MLRTSHITEDPTCEKCRGRLGEYTDGTLPAVQEKFVETHLKSCADCAALAGDFRKIRADLRALPRPQTSAGFESALLARLHAAPTRTFRTGAQKALRPLLALGAAAAAVAGLLFFHPTSPITRMPPAPVAPIDAALVGHCVAQHKADADTQPLADPSARVLSDRLADASMGDNGL